MCSRRSYKSWKDYKQFLEATVNTVQFWATVNTVQLWHMKKQNFTKWRALCNKIDRCFTSRAWLFYHSPFVYLKFTNTSWIPGFCCCGCTPRASVVPSCFRIYPHWIEYAAVWHRHNVHVCFHLQTLYSNFQKWIYNIETSCWKIRVGILWFACMNCGRYRCADHESSGAGPP